LRKYEHNFIYARKLGVAFTVPIFTVPIFTKLIITELNFYVLMHLNLALSREITGISGCTGTALCKVGVPVLHYAKWVYP